MRLLIVVMLSLSLGLSACKKCAMCEITTRINGPEISETKTMKEYCGDDLKEKPGAYTQTLTKDSITIHVITEIECE